MRLAEQWTLDPIALKLSLKVWPRRQLNKKFIWLPLTKNCAYSKTLFIKAK